MSLGQLAQVALVTVFFGVAIYLIIKIFQELKKLEE
jgi:hypothetical protein